MLYPNIEKLIFYGMEMVHSNGICILDFKACFFLKKMFVFFCLFL